MYILDTIILIVQVMANKYSINTYTLDFSLIKIVHQVVLLFDNGRNLDFKHNLVSKKNLCLRCMVK